MDTLKTKSGKTYDSDYAVVLQNPQMAFIRVFTTLTEIATVFSNPAETEQLWQGENYLAGYTKLVSIVPEGDAIKICLEKE